MYLYLQATSVSQSAEGEEGVRGQSGKLHMSLEQRVYNNW